MLRQLASPDLHGEAIACTASSNPLATTRKHMSEATQLAPNTLFVEVPGAGLPKVDGLYVPSQAAPTTSVRVRHRFKSGGHFRFAKPLLAPPQPAVLEAVAPDFSPDCHVP